MRNIVFSLVMLSFAVPASSADFNLDQIRLPDLSEAVEVPVAEVSAPAEEPVEGVSQDLLYKFQQLRNDLSRIENDTIWVRSDINRLESDARRIEQGSSSAFFASDLRRMKYDMERRKNDLKRLKYDLKDLLNRAVKDDKLNQYARDIEWDARDLDNRFQFDIVNAAQSLESTVRYIDPKIIGYDAQWNASDLSRACRDIQWTTRDMRWDASDLVRKTQP